MDDPVLNCVLEICCGPLKAEAALGRAIEKYCGDNPTSGKVAEFICHNFDLAEKGTLQPFKESVARLARGPRADEPAG